MWWACGWTHRRQLPRSDPLPFHLPWPQAIPGREGNQLDVGISGVSKRSMRINFRLSGLSREAFELLDHSYELGKRFRLHLLHCPAALDFHSTLRSSKLVRNLFIEHARDDPWRSPPARAKSMNRSAVGGWLPLSPVHAGHD